jgi:glycosyltransferase involved in cell wall biosynthesis
MLKETSVKTIPMYFNGKFDLKAARRIKEIVKNENIDIINSQSGKDRYAVIWSRIFYGNNCIHINTRRQRPLSGGGFLVNRFISGNTEKIVAVSHSIKKELVKMGYPADHVEVIHNGTPKDKYPIPNPQKIMTLKEELRIDGSAPVIGSVSRPKKHEQLLKALGLIDSEIILILVGIEENEGFRKIIEGYRVNHKVHFIGTVTNERALDYLQVLDMMVLPSTMEGISQSLLEAMALGIPVIATNASGNPELIEDGENGLLFEDGDIQGLADNIRNILDHPEKAIRFSKVGKETALDRFSIENTVEKYEALFSSILI